MVFGNSFRPVRYGYMHPVAGKYADRLFDNVLPLFQVVCERMERVSDFTSAPMVKLSLGHGEFRQFFRRLVAALRHRGQALPPFGDGLLRGLDVPGGDRQWLGEKQPTHKAGERCQVAADTGQGVVLPFRAVVSLDSACW